MSDCTAESGTCHDCRSACSHKPGWFMPGEAERAAENMGVPLDKFFRRYLSVDWWEAGEEFTEDVFVLSPAVVGEEAGEEFPADPWGTCVFYVEGRCQIHEAKPHECRAYWCGTTTKAGVEHQAVATAWQGHQGQIRDLLGREPYAAEYEGGIFGLLSMLDRW